MKIAKETGMTLRKPKETNNLGSHTCYIRYSAECLYGTVFRSLQCVKNVLFIASVANIVNNQRIARHILLSFVLGKREKKLHYGPLSLS